MELEFQSNTISRDENTRRKQRMGREESAWKQNTKKSSELSGERVDWRSLLLKDIVSIIFQLSTSVNE